METINYPLSNMQIELLKLFSRDIEEKDLIELKKLIVTYLSKSLLDKAEQVWEERNWSNKEMDELANTHLRTPYKDPKN